MKHVTEPAYTVDIFVAGSVADATRICREHCMEIGLCVTVAPTEFVYTGGAESGVRVGLVNYPRFPALPSEIREKAIALAERLMVGLYQTSALVQGSDVVVWVTRRSE